MPSEDFKTIVIANEPNELKDVFDLGDFRVGIFNKMSQSPTATENQDALFVCSDKSGHRLGVADGAGGHPRGKDAAFEVVQEMSHFPGEGHVVEQIELANNRVKALKAGAHTTLCMAQISEEVVRFYFVGDSEIVYWNGQGRMVYSSVPHSVVGAKIESGQVSQSESLDDPERNIVTNMMGDDFIRIAATSDIEVKKGHTILIGSDGLFDNIDHESLGQIAAAGKFDEGFEQLAQLCQGQDPATWKKDDDIVFILVRKLRSQ